MSITSGTERGRRSFLNRELVALFGLAALWAASSEVVWKALPFQLILLAIPVATLGFLQSVNIAANLVTEIPAGAFVDRRGRKIAIVWGMGSMGLFTLLLALSRDIVLLAIFIFLISVADSIFLRGAGVRFFEAAAESARGRGAALFSVAVSAGGFAGLALAGVFSGLGYGVIYLVLGLAALLAALLASPSLRDVSKPPTEKTKPLPARNPLRKLSAILNDFRTIRDRRFLGYSVMVQVFMSLSAGSAWVFVPALGLFARLEPSQILILLATVQLVSGGASYAGGWASDKLDKRTFFIARPATAVATYVVLALASSPLIFVVAVLVSTATSFVGPGSSAYFIGRFDPLERGKAGSINTFFTSAIGVAAPLLGVLLWAISPPLLYAFAAAAALPGVLAAYVAVKH